MRKFLVVALLLTSLSLFAQTPSPAQSPDYALKFQFSIGPSLSIVNGTKEFNVDDSLAGYFEFTIPVSDRFSFRTAMMSNWGQIRTLSGSEKVDFNQTLFDGDLRFTFNPKSQYQFYVLGGVQAYYASYYGEDYSFSKLTYTLGTGGYFHFNGTKFVVNPELRYAPETETFSIRVKADVAIWKEKIFITPEVRYGNFSVDYYSDQAVVKFHTDDWKIGCALTWKF